MILEPESNKLVTHDGVRASMIISTELRKDCVQIKFGTVFQAEHSDKRKNSSSETMD